MNIHIQNTPSLPPSLPPGSLTANQSMYIPPQNPSLNNTSVANSIPQGGRVIQKLDQMIKSGGEGISLAAKIGTSALIATAFISIGLGFGIGGAIFSVIMFFPAFSLAGCSEGNLKGGAVAGFSMILTAGATGLWLGTFLSNEFIKNIGYQSKATEALDRATKSLSWVSSKLGIQDFRTRETFIKIENEDYVIKAKRKEECGGGWIAKKRSDVNSPLYTIEKNGTMKVLVDDNEINESSRFLYDQSDEGGFAEGSPRTFSGAIKKFVNTLTTEYESGEEVYADESFIKLEKKGKLSS